MHCARGMARGARFEIVQMLPGVVPFYTHIYVFVGFIKYLMLGLEP